MYKIVPSTLGATKVIKDIVSPEPFGETSIPTSNDLKTVINPYYLITKS